MKKIILTVAVLGLLYASYFYLTKVPDKKQSHIKKEEENISIAAPKLKPETNSSIMSKEMHDMEYDMQHMKRSIIYDLNRAKKISDKLLIGEDKLNAEIADTDAMVKKIELK